MTIYKGLSEHDRELKCANSQEYLVCTKMSKKNEENRDYKSSKTSNYLWNKKTK